MKTKAISIRSSLDTKILCIGKASPPALSILILFMSSITCLAVNIVWLFPTIKLVPRSCEPSLFSTTTGKTEGLRRSMIDSNPSAIKSYFPYFASDSLKFGAK